MNEAHTPSAQARRVAIHRTPIVSERVRRIDGSFAFLPHRFLREGFFVSLTPDELRLYALLVLAADRNGMSFYHYDSICSLLEVPLEVYVQARNGGLPLLPRRAQGAVHAVHSHCGKSHQRVTAPGKPGLERAPGR